MKSALNDPDFVLIGYSINEPVLFVDSSRPEPTVLVF